MSCFDDLIYYFVVLFLFRHGGVCVRKRCWKSAASSASPSRWPLRGVWSGSAPTWRPRWGLCWFKQQQKKSLVIFIQTSGVFYPQALGTAIASTKVMKAQQVVKGEDGNEVSSTWHVTCSKTLRRINIYFCSNEFWMSLRFLTMFIVQSINI